MIRRRARKIRRRAKTIRRRRRKTKRRIKKKKRRIKKIKRIRTKRTKKTRKKTSRIIKTRKKKTMTRRNKTMTRRSKTRKIKRMTNVMLQSKRRSRRHSTRQWTLSARASQKHGPGSKTKVTGSVKSVTRAKSAHTFATTTFQSRPLSTVTMVSGWTPVLLTKNAFNPSQSMYLISFDQKTTNHLIFVITCIYFNWFQFLKLLTINLLKRLFEFVIKNL